MYKILFLMRRIASIPIASVLITKLGGTWNVETKN